MKGWEDKKTVKLTRIPPKERQTSEHKKNILDFKINGYETQAYW